MKNWYFLSITLIAAIAMSACQPEVQEATGSKKESSHEITFVTSDSIMVYGDMYVQSKDAPTVLLFHQAGANARGEYKRIIPVLREQGFNVLAIDQRVGGQTFGNYNRTIANFERNTFGYCDAYPDLEGALDFLIEEGLAGPSVIWGSSYSAALVVQLASNRQDDLSGILVFSPASGEPMEGCKPEQFFDSIKIPFLLLRPSSEMVYDHVKSQYELAQELGHQVYTAQNGRHGSSMLDESRVEANVDENWKVVLDFLSQFKN